MQDSDHEIDRLLCTGSDHDLFWIALNRACSPQIVTDRPAKFGQAARIGIAEMAVTERAEDARAELPPQFHCPGIHQGAPQIERALITLHRDVDEIVDRQRLLGLRAGSRGRLPATRWPAPF